MKKRLFLSVIYALALGSICSCEDVKDEPKAPVINDVVATYAGDKLVAELDGEKIKTGSIEFVKESDTKITVKLTDIIEGVKTFSIKGCTYESLTKNFYSKVTGEGTESGVKVKFEGSVENNTLTSKIFIVPPTIEDVIATYLGDSLKLKVNDADVKNSTVRFIKEDTDKITVRLRNITENIDSIDIKGCIYKTLTKGYYSQIVGEVSDDLLGYTIKFTGDVENNVLTSVVTVSEFGEVANVSDFRNLTYKGEMNIDVTGMGASKLEQRIYTAMPKDRSDDKLKIQIENFSFTGINIGTITLDTVAFTKRGNVYGFNIAERELQITALAELGKVTVKGNGTIIDNKLTTTLYITVGDAGDMKVKVVFGGDKTAEDSNPNFDIKLECEESVVPFGQKDEYSSDMLLTVWESANPEKLVLTPSIVLNSEKSTIDSIYIFTAKTGEKTTLKLTDAVDFSKFTADDYLYYYVKAEDIRRYRAKKVFVKRVANTVLSFNMAGEWIKTDNGFMNFEEPINFTSSNTAAAFLSLYGLVLENPVSRSTDNKYAVLKTLNTAIENPNNLVPAITAATMFNGAFVINMENTLKSTKFGEIYTYKTKPSKLKVTYKYQSGPKFFKSVPRHLDGDNTDTALIPEEVVGKSDKGVISAYLYEVADYTMNDDNILTGVDINKSDKVALKVYKVCDNISELTTIEIPFEAVNGKKFDTSKKYRLAIVCTPSMEGDLFAGSPESTLTIGNIEVILE